MLSKKYSISEIESAATWIMQYAKCRSAIAFYGQMGAGKTTLIQAICNRQGVVDTVTSPTFSIINEYRCTNGNIIYHFDFYRIKNIDEALQIGVEEYFNGSGLCLIEWAELIEFLLPENTLHIKIDMVSANERILTFINES
jgi:tRNA threonylcarbamoyladenosine biosynthesis protein TsaE